jgi:poly-gamma-glutamate capsule biosynthesis protein CapA/YwtB (metallophosphatase superfamily)
MVADKIDWQSGTWQNSQTGDASTEIAICSDWAPIRDYNDIILKDPIAVYGDLLPELRRADVRIVNLECPLVDNAAPVSKSGTVLKGSPGHLAGLTSVPFEIATLGNNHVFDYGVDAFLLTRELLHESGIQSLGAGLAIEEASQPLVFTSKGIEIGLINFSEGEDLTAAGKDPGVYGWEIDRVVQQVREVKKDLHAVIVICHAGVEYIPYPPPYLAAALQRIATAGADLIIGHHPHVPQGVQICHQVPICYSLGNFVFFQYTDLQWRKLGYFVRAGLAEKGISHIEIVPYEIFPDGLRSLRNRKFKWFMTKLKAISDPLDDVSQVQAAWHGFIRYYGLDGFRDEIAKIMQQLDQEPAKGAAMFRNRLTTMQHSRHLVDTMARIINGSIDDAPQWAFDTLAEWLNLKTADTSSGGR